MTHIKALRGSMHHNCRRDTDSDVGIPLGSGVVKVKSFYKSGGCHSKRTLLSTGQFQRGTPHSSSSQQSGAEDEDGKGKSNSLF